MHGKPNVYEKFSQTNYEKLPRVNTISYWVFVFSTLNRQHPAGLEIRHTSLCTKNTCIVYEIALVIYFKYTLKTILNES